MRIKHNERLQVAGLLALAQVHNTALRDIESAICELVGEKPFEGGHVGDALFSWPVYSADTLLKKIDAQRKCSGKPK